MVRVICSFVATFFKWEAAGYGKATGSLQRIKNRLFQVVGVKKTCKRFAIYQHIDLMLSGIGAKIHFFSLSDGLHTQKTTKNNQLVIHLYLVKINSVCAWHLRQNHSSS
ncbi:hypothetical protein D3C86_1745940 [compost metagenome]